MFGAAEDEEPEPIGVHYGKRDLDRVGKVLSFFNDNVPKNRG